MSEHSIALDSPRRFPAGPVGTLRSGRVVAAALVVLAVPILLAEALFLLSLLRPGRVLWSRR